MKNILFGLFAVCSLALFNSCDDCNNPKSFTYDCTFVQVDENMDGVFDEEEQKIVGDCTEAKFTSAKEAKENIIGDWVIVGHAEGWITSYSQPCGYLSFTEDELTYQFESNYTDTIVTMSYDINEFTSANVNHLTLEVGDNYLEGLNINVFCSDYMIEHALALDGNMYIYKKVD